ncbi:hypothetical protein [Stutzerimonas kirkiae]|uniref:Uncharacterized protein n=1 Tax=Stutzerimonas kirkiae TaxID=2211392 RepID=A0A4Q9QWW0_9GAMM|nr:hypothetical protein [Stutzerimonas kirkiae]TBU88870.1 hypothetical protein DNJ96_18025 [Stutzerimonas kirkiae]TBU99006.1 hypothetical protein DNJ95_17335 [Stutzerimonas kirkiae]
MDTQTLIGAALDLLFLGDLTMSQVGHHWQTTSVWLLLRLIGIALFCMVIALQVKVSQCIATIFINAFMGRNRRRSPDISGAGGPAICRQFSARNQLIPSTMEWK